MIKKWKKSRNINSKQILQRLSITLAQIKANNTSGNLLNEIRKIIYFLKWAKYIAKTKFMAV